MSLPLLLIFILQNGPSSQSADYSCQLQTAKTQAGNSCLNSNQAVHKCLKRTFSPQVHLYFSQSAHTHRQKNQHYLNCQIFFSFLALQWMNECRTIKNDLSSSFFLQETAISCGLLHTHKKVSDDAASWSLKSSLLRVLRGGFFKPCSRCRRNL